MHLSPVPPSPGTAVATLFAERNRLIASIGMRFPNVPKQDLEDAVQGMLVDLLVRPEPFLEAEAQGASHLFRLAYTVTWRRVRGHLRRAASRRERSVPEVPEHDAPVTTMETAIDLRRRLARLDETLDIAAGTYGAGRRDALRRALAESLETPDASGTEIAARHGIPREYLSRARTWLRASLQAA